MKSNPENTAVQNASVQKILRWGKSKRVVQRIMTYLLMSVIAFVFLIPLFWMLSTSLKDDAAAFAWPPQWVPEDPQWNNYVTAFTLYPLGRFLLNTLFLAIICILGGFVSVPLAAYGFARLRFPGKKVLFTLVLGTMMVPLHAMLIPLFTMFRRLKMIDTYWPLMLPYIFGNPFFIFLMMQYIKSLPKDLDDAARIDGVGTFGILYRIVLPLCIPVLTILVAYTFLWVWNEFLRPLIFINSFDKFPIQLGLAMFRQRFNIQWNLLMAATLVSIIPILVVYFFIQRHLIGGIASVGLKG